MIAVHVGNYLLNGHIKTRVHFNSFSVFTGFEKTSLAFVENKMNVSLGKLYVGSSSYDWKFICITIILRLKPYSSFKWDPLTYICKEVSIHFDFS